MEEKQRGVSAGISKLIIERLYVPCSKRGLQQCGIYRMSYATGLHAWISILNSFTFTALPFVDHPSQQVHMSL
jgi:hypothetical protein